MSFDDFKKDAIVTESRPEKLMVNPTAVAMAMALNVVSSELLDLFKKGAFYGKPMDNDQVMAHLAGIYGIMGGIADVVMNEGLANDGADAEVKLHRLNPKTGEAEEKDAAEVAANLNLRLAHAFIGATTEAGELLRAQLEAAFDGVPVDAVNVSEEYGDLDWYKAIAFDELGLSEEASRTAVIAKLKKRYGDKFDAAKAVSRDLDEERKILEDLTGG